MKPELKSLIEENKVELIRSYVYKRYIGYEIKVLWPHRFMICRFCDLHKVNNCLSIIDDDINNVNNCITVESISDTVRIRYLYERISSENISLFLSRYLLNTLS